MMKSFPLLVISLLLAACGGRAAVPQTAAAPGLGASPPFDGNALSHVYWTLANPSPAPQVQFALVPLTTKSKATNIFSNSHNMLSITSGIRTNPLGQLWILSFGQYNGNPSSASVFDLPLTPQSAAKYTFVLKGSVGAKYMTFDASGRLWVNSNNAVLRYDGPFKKSGSLSPKIKLTKGVNAPYGVAVDKRGSLYVANFASLSKSSIAIFAAPISNRTPKYLDGVAKPAGLVFDKRGNLYASNNFAGNAVVRYNSSDLKPGDKPSIVDGTDLPGDWYGSDFAFSPSGDLYVAVCGGGSGAQIEVYPTSKKPFSSKLAPSVHYTNSYLMGGATCGATGIAIK